MTPISAFRTSTLPTFVPLTLPTPRPLGYNTGGGPSCGN